jgi:hypothetical protein
VLCDNLLAANWSAEALRRLAILGNSFDTYQQRWSGPSSGRPSTRRPDKLLALVEHGASQNTHCSAATAFSPVHDA